MTTKASRRKSAVRLKRDHFGLAVYETPSAHRQGRPEWWAVGTPAEIDRAVDNYIRDQMIHKARSELLCRYQPGVDIDAFVRSKSLAELDAAIARLMRWVIAREPGRFLGMAGASPRPRQARVEGLDLPARLMAIRVD